MNFWKTSFWSLFATGIKMLSQFFVAKVIAVFSGPAAFGIFGQFLSFVNLIQLSSGGAFSSGVVKYSSEYHHQRKRLNIFLQTALKAAIFSSFAIGALIALFSKQLSYYVFQSHEYWWVLVAFGTTLFGYTLNQLFISIFKGLNYIKRYAKVTILGAFFSLILISSLTYFFSTKGILLGYVFSQLCMFLAGYIFIKKTSLHISLFRLKINYVELKKLMLFALMPITSAILFPLAEIFLRNHIANNSSWNEVGNWQAVLRISDAYLVLIVAVISNYALPKYSRLNSKEELKKEVFSLIIKLVPVAIVLGFIIFTLKHYIILILFSEKFLSAEPLFYYQLIGDVFKVASYIIAYILIAKSLVRTYIVLELIFTSSYLILSIFCFNLYELIGLTMAFMINNFAYFLVVLFWFLIYTNQKK